MCVPRSLGLTRLQALHCERHACDSSPLFGVVSVPCGGHQQISECPPNISPEWPDHREPRRIKMTCKNTICLWYNTDALNAANFYAKTFPDSTVGAVHRAPGDYPSGKE